jgi:hypothetical protein
MSSSATSEPASKQSFATYRHTYLSETLCDATLAAGSSDRLTGKFQVTDPRIQYATIDPSLPSVNVTYSVDHGTRPATNSKFGASSVQEGNSIVLLPKSTLQEVGKGFAGAALWVNGELYPNLKGKTELDGCTSTRVVLDTNDGSDSKVEFTIDAGSPWESYGPEGLGHMPCLSGKVSNVYVHTPDQKSERDKAKLAVTFS